MEETVYLLTIVLGLGSVAAYVVASHKRNQKVNLSVMVNMFLFASGIVYGLFLMFSTFIPTLKENLAGLNLYIFIAGFVVLFVSCQSIYSEIARK